MRSSVLLQTLLSSSSVRLGRLVLNTRSPHQDYLDPFDDDGRPTTKESITTTHTNFEETRKFSKSSKLRSYFADVLSVSYRSENDGVSSLSAPHMITHDLENSGTWFQNACARAETREWLENAIDSGKTVYLVVGYRTLRDARLTQTASSESVHGANAQLPAAVLAGVTPVVDVKPGVEVGHGNRRTESSVLNAPGEQVFAVQYRKMKFQWLSSRKIKNIVLDDTRWKAYWEWRGPEDDDSENEDVLEVDLTDSSDCDISDDEYFGDDRKGVLV